MHKYTAPDQRLKVTAERHAEPDWDRFIAALAALALREVDEESEGDEDEEDRG